MGTHCVALYVDGNNVACFDVTCFVHTLLLYHTLFFLEQQQKITEIRT